MSAFIGQTKSIKPEEKKMNSSAAALGGCHSLVWHLLKVTLFVPIGIFKPTAILYVKGTSNYSIYRRSLLKLNLISSYFARITVIIQHHLYWCYINKIYSYTFDPNVFYDTSQEVPWKIDTIYYYASSKWLGELCTYNEWSQHQ